MSAEYQPNLSFVSQIPAEFLKLREYSANPDISLIFLSASRNLKKNSAEGSEVSLTAKQPRFLLFQTVLNNKQIISRNRNAGYHFSRRIGLFKAVAVS